MTSPYKKMMEDEMENKLERKFVLGLKIHADSWKRLIAEVKEIYTDMLDIEENNVNHFNRTFGGSDIGGSLVCKINPDQTHDNYFIELQKWLDENKKRDVPQNKEEPKGLYPKYKIVKTDGSPVDPGAKYFTVRIDTDPHARAAVRAYIESCREENPELARDLEKVLEETNPFL